MKVFISQPMNGKTDMEIELEREWAISRIKDKWPDAEIVDSYFADYKPSTGNVALKYLAKSLELMADADVVWFCSGWERARGCAIENECAISYGLDVLEDYTGG
jgi:hypothetical protein